MSEVGATWTVALIGNPNTGKSSLFNALCGMNARVGNFPGVTVEKKLGTFQEAGSRITLIDLPGTYSLAARSEDEWVSVDVLLDRAEDVQHIDAVLVIVDAAHIERNLYLFSQVRDLGLPTLLVLNMWDRLEEQGVQIDVGQLESRLGVPVVVTSANRRTGVDQVRKRLVSLLRGEVRCVAAPELFPEAFVAERSRLRDSLSSWKEPPPAFLLDRWLLDISGDVRSRDGGVLHPELKDRLAESRARLQEAGVRIPACETKLRYGWIREQLQGVVQRRIESKLTFSDHVDRWVTHRFFGIVLFLLVMFVVFQAIYSGDVWMGRVVGIEDRGLFGWLIEEGQGWLSGLVEGWIPDGALRSLLQDGVIAGVGGVLVFLPQIAILFFFIAILEDCGYMARAAFLMDKVMVRLGLSGKSFLPLLSSFACAVPGIMGTRVIENRRDRMVTILVAPLMSCSARFPVYVLMISAFVPATSYLGGWVGLQALTLLGMQLLGACVAIPVAWALKRYFFPGPPAPFVMELPSYKWPAWRVVGQRVWERVVAFLYRAGTLILATSIVVWGAGYFPSDQRVPRELRAKVVELQTASEGMSAEEGDRLAAWEGELAEVKRALNEANAKAIEGSFLGMAGKWIEPAVKPLGWDWRIGVGVVASFPAREVIIATLGTIYRLGSSVDESDEGLKETLREARWPDGRPVFGLPVAMSIMVFFALCAQCAATLMVIKRETNSWRWPIFTFVYMTSLAYVGAWLTYQGMSWLG